jgi:hypothetical protein
VPFIARDVDIRVADAAKKNFNLHVVRAGIAALEIERRERRGLGEGGEGLGVIHESIVSTAAKNFHRLIKVTQQSGDGRFARSDL